jgi:cytochrome P450
MDGLDVGPEASSEEQQRRSNLGRKGRQEPSHCFAREVRKKPKSGDAFGYEHLGFSSGIHLCFGGLLARLEPQIAVGEFVRRAVNPRLVVDPRPIDTVRCSAGRATS